MKSVERIFIDSLCVLLLMEMLAACTNSEPEIDVDRLSQRNGGNSNKPPEGHGIGRSMQTHKRKPIADGARYYQVEEGDTLYSIAKRAKVNLDTLAKWNNIAAPYTIFIKQKIRLFNSGRTEKSSVQPSRQAPKKAPKSADVAHKIGISSQKKLILSIDNRKVLKFYCEWPTDGKILKNFSQSGNKGIDIASQLGRPVKAAAAGTVVYSGQGLLGYGKLLIIKHDEEFLSAYGNNSKLLVTEGQQVEKGRIIAEVGIGARNKAALHFEIRKNGEPVNPIEYLPKK